MCLKYVLQLIIIVRLGMGELTSREHTIFETRLFEYYWTTTEGRVADLIVTLVLRTLYILCGS